MALNEQKVAELKARLTTIGNMAATGKTRELVGVIKEVLTALKPVEAKSEMGFAANKEVI